MVKSQEICGGDSDEDVPDPTTVNRRVFHKKGIDWDTFRDDVVAMCDAAIARDHSASTSRGPSLTKTAKKIKEVISNC
jgi:hypothetical protein